MIGYKLTDQDMQTFNYTQWQIGKWKETSGSGNLCSPGWLHYYSDPFLAVLLNPIHADFQNPRLFEAEVAGRVAGDNGLKFGCTKMRLVKELGLPIITTEQRIKFAILCALEVSADPEFITWANKWLNGTDRSAKSANKTHSYLYETYAKSATLYAAEAATIPYRNPVPYDVPWLSACSARNASENNTINLIEIAKKAMK